MDERTTPSATERPIGGESTGATTSTGGPAHLADPRALTILTTEHWSLLTSRSLVYNEAFARAGMFLTFLSATLVALGFVSGGGMSGDEFLVVATVLLGFDLLIGVATLGRVSSASTEEFRALQGMNRLRHAYLEMVPSLEPYFSTSPYDDALGVLAIYGATPARPSPGESFIHGLTTIPGMIGMITAVVGGAFAASLVLLAGGTPMSAVGGGVVAAAAVLCALWVAGVRAFGRINRELDVRFPSPQRESPAKPGQT
ncbi:MAG TPA: hypothetical protein VKA85_01435 [Candidatus Limnocylindrales bacterium]|nr:hypothetical protein [Candidatus Limnocylindrales bacterium]